MYTNIHIWVRIKINFNFDYWRAANMERTNTKIKYVGWPKTERSYRTGFSLTPTGGLAALLHSPVAQKVSRK
jgi:hypothetical protein